jgi:hypothetical protein
MNDVRPAAPLVEDRFASVPIASPAAAESGVWFEVRGHAKGRGGCSQTLHEAEACNVAIVYTDFVWKDFTPASSNQMPLLYRRQMTLVSLPLCHNAARAGQRRIINDR